MFISHVRIYFSAEPIDLGFDDRGQSEADLSREDADQSADEAIGDRSSV